MALWLGALDESYHTTKFGGHKYLDSGDIMALICHLILENHVI